MEIIKPEKLQKGDLIALVAPSSYCAPEDSASVKVELEKLGFRVFVHPQCLARDHMSAGTTAEKLAALHECFGNPDIKAIFCLRGGYRAIHLLDGLDYALIKANPKILLGYSDITALHAAIMARTGLVMFHGPIARNFVGLADPALIVENKNNQAALDFLTGQIPDNLFVDRDVKVIQAGQATGKLWGGNLQLLSSLIQAGSRYHPALDKSILLIEDIGEEITKIDSQLGAWRLRGIFKNLAGLVVGHMTNIKDTPGSAGAFVHQFEDVLREHAREMVGPIITRAPFGHEYPNYICPLGLPAQLTASKKPNEKAALSLLENPFRQ